MVTLIQVVTFIQWTLIFLHHVKEVEESQGKKNYDFKVFIRVQETFLLNLWFMCLLYAPSFKYVVYAYVPVYVIGANVYDYITYSYFKNLENDSANQLMAHIMEDNLINSVLYRIAMAFLASSITWLVNERELIMFFREQDQKEVKE